MCPFHTGIPFHKIPTCPFHTFHALESNCATDRRRKSWSVFGLEREASLVSVNIALGHDRGQEGCPWQPSRSPRAQAVGDTSVPDVNDVARGNPSLHFSSNGRQPGQVDHCGFVACGLSKPLERRERAAWMSACDSQHGICVDRSLCPDKPLGGLGAWSPPGETPLLLQP